MPERAAGPIDFVLLEFPEDANTKAWATRSWISENAT